ncbi:MAG: hypothetical protein FWF44_08465 [Defluviitaleaceae bacterium]|nr:hypothetical protein [Defluviitaleaceae bacterium]
MFKSRNHIFPRAAGFVLAVILAFGLASCARNDALAELQAMANSAKAAASPTPAQTQGTGQTQEAGQTDGAPAPQDGMAITWGYTDQMPVAAGNYFYSISTAPDERTTYLAQELDGDFGVTITPQKYAIAYLSGGENLTSYDMPDVFTMLGDRQALIDSGLIRTIPLSMVYQYAPKYADALRASDTALANYTDPGDSSSLYGLVGYNSWRTLAQTFSVYRLDWLDKIGVTANGGMTQVADRVYFTDQPFTQDQFMDIMQKFSNLGPTGSAAQACGLAMETPAAAVTQSKQYLHDSFSTTYSLLGMFGLNSWSTEENGKFAFSMVTDQYRNYLLLIQQLAQEGTILSSSNPDADILNGNVGWWNDGISSFSNTYGTSEASTILKNNPDAKLLIAPPEVSADGRSGVTVTTTDPFTYIPLCVNANVDDAKLAVILQIFEALSYEPDLWVEAMYGKEGVDWDWAGDEYGSQVITKQLGTTIFHPNVVDSSLGDFTLDTGLDSVVAAYVRQNGDRLALRYAIAYDDFSADVQAKLASFDPDNSKYTDFASQGYVYLADVAAGNKDVGSTWDDYVAGMDAAYAAEYYSIIGQ